MFMPSTGTPRTTTERALRASSCRRLVATVAWLSVIGLALSAHRREDYLQAARIDVRPDRIVVTLDLTPGVAVAESFVSRLDKNRDGALSVNEQRTYGEQVVRALQLGIDGRALQPRLQKWHFAEPAAIRRGEGTIRLSVGAKLTGLTTGTHQLRFGNSHLANHSAFLANALVPETMGIAITAQRRNATQSELTIGFTVQAKPAIAEQRKDRRAIPVVLSSSSAFTAPASRYGDPNLRHAAQHRKLMRCRTVSLDPVRPCGGRPNG